ncbi:hypothetical protein J1N35_038426 [Gossypium stocksii]|uniref:Uncharacterized protein n=1 Tax=Gossypium stocksii TaxID=47602 RepID=A0A9D3ZMQ8_9ROSI|nr:hypothetical protein J1N35_038426 [Gossypium stocksii]
MSKEEFEQRLARKSLRETLSAVEERVGRLEVRSDGSQGKSPERREELRQQDETEGNQVSAIREPQRGRCENGWGRMSRARVQSP